MGAALASTEPGTRAEDSQRAPRAGAAVRARCLVLTIHSALMIVADTVRCLSSFAHESTQIALTSALVLRPRTVVFGYIARTSSTGNSGTPDLRGLLWQSCRHKLVMSSFFGRRSPSPCTLSDPSPMPVKRISTIDSRSATSLVLMRHWTRQGPSSRRVDWCISWTSTRRSGPRLRCNRAPR
jgi:hypothetical protein